MQRLDEGSYASESINLTHSPQVCPSIHLRTIAFAISADRQSHERGGKKGAAAKGVTTTLRWKQSPLAVGRGRETQQIKGNERLLGWKTPVGGKIS